VLSLKALSALTVLAERQEDIRPVNNRVMSCWHGYLSEARCKWFAYGLGDTTATPSSVASLQSRFQNGVYLLVPAYPGCPGKEAAKRVFVFLFVTKLSIFQTGALAVWQHMRPLWMWQSLDDDPRRKQVSKYKLPWQSPGSTYSSTGCNRFAFGDRRTLRRSSSHVMVKGATPVNVSDEYELP